MLYNLVFGIPLENTHSALSPKKGSICQSTAT